MITSLRPAARRQLQLLGWERYRSQRDHELEMVRLFRAGWQCIGAKDDIPKSGDYRTFDLFGRPIIVQNQGDRVAAFHNVCPHRNAQLTSCPRAAWPSSSAAITVDYLGTEVFNRLVSAFGTDMRPIATWTVDYDCNWKVLIENTAEDYHISSVHFATSGDTPPYSQIVHTLDEKFSLYENRAPDFASRSMRWLARQLRPEAQFTYYQYVSYPALIFALSPLTSHLHLLVPTSPNTCRTIITVFLGTGVNPIGRILHHLIRRPVVRLSKRFVEEDRLICADIQRGIAVARFPRAIGAREERVHAFQRYLVDQCGPESSP